MNAGLLELRDIHLPEAVSWWPPAPGWWVLLLVFSGVAFWWARWYWNGRGRRRVIREARQEFAEICARYHHDHCAERLLAELSILLRRVAISLYPGVAGLTGQAWLRALDRCHGGNGFSAGPGRLLAVAPYRPQAPPRNMEVLIELIELWLRTQRRGGHVQRL